MVSDFEMTPGQVLLVMMRQLQDFTDDELRTAVRMQVTSAVERRKYERLSTNVSHDKLLLLSARALAHQVMQVRAG